MAQRLSWYHWGYFTPKELELWAATAGFLGPLGGVFLCFWLLGLQKGIPKNANHRNVFYQRKRTKKIGVSPFQETKICDMKPKINYTPEV